MQSLFRHIAVLLVVIYLFIPVMGLAHAGVPFAGTAVIRTIDGREDSPCENCPCSQENDSHCCDSACCSCAFHCPPVQGMQVRYSPIVIIARHGEPFRAMPQVYLPIFVPPQNLLSDSSPEIFDTETILMPLAVV
jgi:hypothetical protein